MAAKKKDNPKTTSKVPDEIILVSLRDRYFKLLATENYPHTEKISKELDSLEKAIRELLDKEANKAANL